MHSLAPALDFELGRIMERATVHVQGLRPMRSHAVNDC